MSKYDKDKEKIIENIKNHNSFTSLYRFITGKKTRANSTFTNYVKNLGLDLYHFHQNKEGLSKFESKIGNKYGRLKILDIYQKNKDIKVLYYAKCVCDCGTVKDILASNVLSCRTRSCGCLISDPEVLAKRSGKNSKNWKGYGDIPGRWFSTRKKNAKERGYEFSVTIEYIWKLLQKQNNRCCFSGLDLHFSSDSMSSDTTASMDRIDNSKGYIEGNIQWVHKNINYMRGKMDVDSFIAACHLIASNTVLPESKKNIFSSKQLPFNP